MSGSTGFPILYTFPVEDGNAYALALFKYAK